MSHFLCEGNYNNNNPICKAPECQKTSVALSKDTSCMHNFMLHLHGSETWPVKKENKLKLQTAEMRMIRSMCGIEVTDRFTDTSGDLL